MYAARVMSNGDLRLPAELSERLGVKPGDSFEIEIESNGTVRLFPKTLSAADVAGMLKTDIKLSIEEMDEGVADGFRKGVL